MIVGHDHDIDRGQVVYLMTGVVYRRGPAQETGETLSENTGSVRIVSHPPESETWSVRARWPVDPRGCGSVQVYRNRRNG